MTYTLFSEGHPVPNMKRVWDANGEEDWIESGASPCEGCPDCNLVLRERYERDREAGRLPF